MEPLELPAVATEQLTALIQKMAGSCTIYVFGYRATAFSSHSLLADPAAVERKTHHFDLVVFSKKEFPQGEGGLNIGNALAESSGSRITASVLLHRLSDLGTLQPSQQWFFDQVLRKGQRLCLDASAPPYLPGGLPAVKDEKGDRAYWQKCIAVARFNLQAASISGDAGITLCKIALLHTAVVQMALGLIRVHLGYTPRETSLRGLLQLCGHFTELPARLFCTAAPQAISRFKMLCAPPSMLNHWTRLDASEGDFLWLLDACRVFLAGAEEMVGETNH